MNTKRVLVVETLWIVTVLLLSCLSCRCLAEATDTLDEQFAEACACGNNVAVISLLDKGARVNAKNRSGSPALLLAAWAGHLNTVRTLLDNGADINAGDGFGKTPLMMAVGSDRAEVVTLLLSKGADVNARDHLGMTPLMFATMTGSAELVRMIMKRGADPSAKSVTGFTALRRAEMQNDRAIIRLLRRDSAPEDGCQRASRGQQFREASRQIEKGLEVYPDTAEGVVRAFVREALDAAQFPIQEMSSCYSMLLVQNKYFVRRRYLGAQGQNHDIALEGGFSLGMYNVVQGYKIVDVKESNNRATVRVKYARVGRVCGQPIEMPECRDASDNHKPQAKRASRPWDRGTGGPQYTTFQTLRQPDCRFLDITNDFIEAPYSLARLMGKWRIVGVYEPFISVKSAITFLECKKEGLKGVYRRLPSGKQRGQIQEDIRVLQEHLGK